MWRWSFDGVQGIDGLLDFVFAELEQLDAEISTRFGIEGGVSPDM